ncbi:MAG: beta-galactosidase [Planctomycetota bacterium]
MLRRCVVSRVGRAARPTRLRALSNVGLVPRPTLRVFAAWLTAIFAATAILTAAGDAAELTAEVQSVHGFPTLLVNGEPTAPLMFFGWASGGRPYTFELDETWKTYGFSFTAPEDNRGNFGVHIRLGGSGPGTVWIDDVRLYEGPRDDSASANMLRLGGWEGTKEEAAQAWHLFTDKESYGSDAEWDIVTDEKAEGDRACQLVIRSGGSSTMHCHFYQSGMSAKAGQRYTYTVRMKADRKLKGDLQALHHGSPWTLYPPDDADSAYQSQVRMAAAAGIHVHSFGIPMPWPKEGEEPSYKGVARAFDVTLKADPDALLLPRFGMSAPGWWQTDHPDECLLFDDGQRQGECPASPLWRGECLRHLRALVRFCEDNYGDRVLGYHPCGQHTGEWFYQRSWEPRLSGFSPAMTAGFRRWLADRYQTDDALRNAWHDPNVSLQNAEVPTAEERRSTTHGLFRDPQLERKTLDFYEYKQLAMAEPLEQMARVIKEETGGKKIVTLFYGYFFDMSGIPSGPQISGHLAMERMLRCPDVDILCSPISYFDRQSGGAGLFMTAVDSVRAAGKLWLNEDDTRTYLTPEEAGFGRVDTPEKSFWVHQRNYGHIVPRRMACWYMDLGGIGWLNGQDLWDNIRPLNEHYAASLADPATFAPEVAVIVDERSPAAIACNRTIMYAQSYVLRNRLYRMGAPIRVHYLGDLVSGKVPNSKVYIFLNPFYLDRASRDAIARATAGKTAVYFYGSGFLADRADDALVSELVGMSVSRIEAENAEVSFLKGDSPLLKGLADEPFGSKAKLSPLWAVDRKAGVTPLAALPGGETLVAAKEGPDGLRVYIGTTDAPAALLRNVLTASGVHVYVDSDDVISADGRFLALTATGEGTKRVTLPGPATVRNLYDGSVVAAGARNFELPMVQGETRLFVLE